MKKFVKITAIACWLLVLSSVVFASQESASSMGKDLFTKALNAYMDQKDFLNNLSKKALDDNSIKNLPPFVKQKYDECDHSDKQSFVAQIAFKDLDFGRVCTRSIDGMKAFIIEDANFGAPNWTGIYCDKSNNCEIVASREIN